MPVSCAGRVGGDHVDFSQREKCYDCVEISVKVWSLIFTDYKFEKLLFSEDHTKLRYSEGKLRHTCYLTHGMQVIFSSFCLKNGVWGVGFNNWVKLGIVKTS